MFDKAAKFTKKGYLKLWTFRPDIRKRFENLLDVQDWSRPATKHIRSPLPAKFANTDRRPPHLLKEEDDDYELPPILQPKKGLQENVVIIARTQMQGSLGAPQKAFRTVRVNFMTSTPWENGIHAVAGFVSVIQYHSEQTEDRYTRHSKELWKSIPSLAKATGKRALRYGQDMEAAMKAIKTVKTSMKKKHSQDELNKLETQRKSAQESFDQTMNDFREIILALVIRRDAETHWFNGEIMLKLPRKEKFDMHCSLPGATVDAINKFAETYRGEGDAGDEAALAKGRWLQICATLPGLLNRSLCTTIANEAFNRATRKDKVQPNVLLWTREYANECHLDDLEDPNNPIVKYSSQIVGAGVKIDAITELARQHLGPRDKILIFDFSPITAMVVTAELRRRLKADRVSFYGGKMKQGDKDKLRKKFQTEVDPHILVTSHRQLAVGVDLNAAKTVVHMGPTTDVKALLQGESRVWRFDGETDTDYTVRVYTLYDKKLDIESELLAGRSLREQFASQVGKADGEGASDDDDEEE